MKIVLLSNGDYIAFPAWFYKFWSMRVLSVVVCSLFDYNQYTGEEITVIDIIDFEPSAERTNLSAGREAD